MSDIKLFRTTGDAVEEVIGTSVVLEKRLQSLLERNLETFLGVRFLQSEHSTGKTHRGRIDTLGIDENNAPVIIEYKRSIGENVINQGLFYLDWLLDHQAEFTLLVGKRLGREHEDLIDWSAPRLICIAGDFTRYDEHAVAQIGRSIELVRYRRYGDDFLILEQASAPAVGASNVDRLPSSGDVHARPKTKTVLEYLAQAWPSLTALYHSVEELILGVGDDVTKKPTQVYIAFRRLKNFACIEVHPQSEKLLVYLKVDPDSLALEPGFTRDVRTIGHFGTGDLEVTLKTPDHVERFGPLLLRSYDAS